MNDIILHGLKTCDTCRKALKALEQSGRMVRFRDVRAEPLTAAEVARFRDAFGDALLNRASTTWRGLPDDVRAEPPERLIAAHPALMKRPVIEAGAGLHLGWGREVQAALLE